MVDRLVKKARSCAEADEGDRRYYRPLTPEQRLDILLTLIARHQEACGEASRRFERVHRVVELASG